MNMKRISLIFVIALLGILLTACSGSGATNAWSGALISGDTVYYAGSSMVYALKEDNGNIIWQYPEKASASRLFFAEPVLAGDQLIVGDYGKLLTSLKTSDGTENWQFTEAKSRYIDSPLVINDLIIAPNADHNIYALDLDGNEVWRFTGGAAFWAKPVSDGVMVYVPCMDHYLYALDSATGEMKWKTDLGASLVARAALDENGVLYLGNLDGGVFAVNAADGTIAWQTKVSGGVWAEPVLHEGKLYFGDQTGNINILNAVDGTQEQFIQTDSAILGRGGLFENGIIFGNEDGELIMVGFTGAKVWTRTLKGNIYGNLQTSGDRLIVIVNNGDEPLVAMDANGNQNWYFSAK